MYQPKGQIAKKFTFRQINSGVLIFPSNDILREINFNNFVV